MKLRSLLFVPAKEKMMSKIVSLSADGYIIDLEDSIEAGQKDVALQCVVNHLAELEPSKIWVRINADRAEQELTVLKNYPIGFMLSKVTSANQYQRYEAILSEHSVIALIETPMAIVNIYDIASCSYIDALAFGAEDYTASMNMENVERNLSYARLAILNYARAFNKATFDTPSFKIGDLKAFEQEVQLAASMGFEGKLCINPKHINYINECFGRCDLEYIRSVVARYEADENAVVVIDGVIYEKMHIARYKKILRENEGN